MTSTPTKMNPFPGLRPFTQEEDYLFFGREEQTLELLQRLGNTRFVAVVGTSGSGKSSLVRCGLLSELLGGRMLDAGAAWEIAVTHPGGNPLALLTEALLDADLYDREAEHGRENLLATLSRSHFGLVEAVKQADLGEGTNFLLVVDQFEEIFRFQDAGQRQQEAANEFVSLLLEAVAQKEVPIYVVLTMRSDFIGECGQFEGLAEMVNKAEFLIPRLTREQYKRVIEGPIKVAGGQIAPRLLQRLLNDLGQQADQLPCLQHALMRTWNVWSANGDTDALDLDDYQRVGKMSQALSLHADEIYESLASDRQRELCQGIFQALTVEETNSRGIRRPQRLGRLCQILEVPAEELTPIIDAYRQSGVTFLMPAPEVELTEHTIIDISHESLMRVWTRLRQWVEEETQAAGIYLRLSESADLHEQGRAGLYRDPELGIALAWREANCPNAAWAERYRPGFGLAIRFLEASQQASIAEQQAQEAARQRELEQAQQLAEVQQLQLQQQQRAARKLRKLFAGVAVVAVIAAVACVFALFARNEAGRQAEIAAERAEEARQNAEQADHERATAEVAETAAQRAEKRSREFRYATDIQLAARLIGDSHANARQVLDRLADHEPAKNSATSSDDDLRGFEWHYLKRLVDSRGTIFSTGEQPVTDTVLTAEGELGTLDDDGRFQFWDVTTRREKRSALDLKQGRNLSATALSRDGRRVALANAKAKQVHVVDVITGTDARPPISAQALFGIIFSPDGQWLVTLDSKIAWWDTTTGKLIATQDSKLSEAGPLSISADGLTVAVPGPGWCSVFRLDPTAAQIALLMDKQTADMGTPRTAAISPDGRSLFVAQVHTGTVTVFDFSSGRGVKATAFEQASSVSAIGFDPQGTALATACLDGSIKIWPDWKALAAAGSAPQEPIPLIGHRDEITHISFAAAGKQVISASRDRTTRLWDLGLKAVSVHRTLDGVTGRRARFSPDGLLIAAAELEQGRIRLRDAETGHPVRDLPVTVDAGVSPESVAFSPDNRLLAVGYGGKPNVSYIELWEIERGERLAVLPGTTDLPSFETTAGSGVVSTLSFSPDGKFLAAGFGALKDLTVGRRGQFPLKIYDVASRRAIRILLGHENYCTAVTFSRDGSRMASGSNDGTARIWDTATWKTLQVLQNPFRGDLIQKIYHDVAFSPAGDLLAIASHDGTVQVWNPLTAELLQTLRGHANGVTSVAFSPDGRTLASGSYESSVRLWNVATWREVMRLDPEIGVERHSLAFSPDGRQLLATGSPAILWSTQPLDDIPPEQAAGQLTAVLDSQVDFASYFRARSENIRWHDVLEILNRQRPNDARVRGAWAASRINQFASRQDWKQTVESFDQLRSVREHAPDAWFSTAGLLRLATALVHESRPVEAAWLLHAAVGRMKAEGGRMNNERSLHPSSFRLHPSETSAEEPLRSLAALLNERLAQDPRHPELLEFRAELAGLSSDAEAQVADYTAAIDFLAGQANAATTTELQRLYGRRGNAHVALKHWREAVDDYAQCVTDATADETLLSNQALALAELSLNYWTVPKPVEAESKLGSTLSILPDDSILASGSNPTDDRYRIVLTLPADIALAAVRLEMLTDPSLPKNGPGRHPTGNFAQWSWTVFALAPGATDAIPLEFDSVWADPEFQYPIQTNGHLNIYNGGEGRNCLAMWGMSKPVVLTAGTKLTVEMNLKSADGNSENLGHFRLSVSSDPAAIGRARGSLAATKLTDPWQKLAAAYQLQGDQEAIDQLVERRPQLAGKIGDLFTQGQDKAWARALENYSRSITAATTDVELLSRRARAYEGMKDWEAATADWSRAAAGNPGGARLLTEFGRRLAEAGQPQFAATQRDLAQRILETSLRQDADNSLVITELADLLFAQAETAWTSLQPSNLRSEKGTTLTLQGDGSILASGTNTLEDVYTISALSPLDRVAAVRLEALPDASLPNNGPGRDVTGNFLLRAIRLFQSPSDGQTGLQPVPVAGAWASYAYSAPNVDIAGTIDPSLKKYWHVMGRLGQPHQAVFRLREPIVGKDRQFVIELSQAFNLGRFRLSVTGRESTTGSARTKIADPRILLAFAYAQHGQTADAAHWAGTALDDVARIEARISLLEPLGEFPDLFAELRKTRRADPALQLAQTRSLAQRGSEQVGQKQKDQALSELTEARKEFIELLEAYPEPQWTVLKPIELKSQGGATLTPQEDGSILASGEIQYPEVYTLVARPALKQIAGIRLEAIPDPSLPLNGPGRCTCGNFWLNELRLFSRGRPFPLLDVIVADDEAQEFRKIIDGRVDKIASWGKYQKPGEKHTAYLATRMTRDAEDDFKIELHFARGLASRHNLGRFRVSVTADPEALEAERRRIPLQLKESEIVSLDMALAKAQAQQGNTSAAADTYAALLNRPGTRADQAQIIATAAPLPGVLEQLAARTAGNAAVQVELGRNLAKRGREYLADKQPEKAVADLQRSRELIARLRDTAPQWTVLTPVEMHTASGAKMELQTDGSVFVHQSQALKNDACTLVFQLEIQAIKGLRLEVLTDSRLPRGGPGWVDGNFVLNELTLHAAPVGSPDTPRSIALRNASADHNQPGFEAPKAIDGIGSTGWALWPEFNKDRTAVFELAEQIGDGKPVRMTVRLNHELVSQRVQTLGRFRLSVTSDASTLLATRVRWELKDSEVANLYAASAQAQAQLGQTSQAVASFTEALQLVSDRNDKARIISAAAALAAPGSAVSALDDAGKATLRRQALEWMTVELTAWSELLESGAPQERLSIIEALNLWNENTDLAGLRDQPATRAALPEAEQQAFTRLWSDAAALLTKAETGFRALHADAQFEAVRAELKQRNPGKDAQIQPVVENGRVVQLTVNAPGFRDLTPIRALPGLQRLHLSGAEVTDLAPLHGMNLTNLWLNSTEVSDLSPLRGMKLRQLDMFVSQKLSDLSPLRGMPLDSLTIAGTNISDLTPLQDMKLTYFNCDSSQVTDLSPLKNVPLKTLLIHNTKVSDLSLIRGMPLTTLTLYNSKVSDLSPLQGMSITNLQLQGSLVTDLSPLVDLPLTELQCDFQALRDGKMLRAIRTLTRINSKPAADFWNEADRPLVQRLPAVLRGEEKPANNAERLDFARIAYDEKQFTFAARLWAEALETDPQSGDDRLTQIRYHAARAAVLAAAGQGQGEFPATDAANAKLRRQALAWLQAELTAWTHALEAGSPPIPTRVVRVLTGWTQDRDLTGLRVVQALAQLPAAERTAWQTFWGDVAAATDKAALIAQAGYERLLEQDPEKRAAAAQLAQCLLDQQERRNATRWTVLQPTDLKSEGGATLKLLSDGSILSSGTHPNRDDYTLVVPVDLKNITAIALDILPHESHAGNVGRGTGGGCILSEFEISIQDESGRQQPVVMKEAVADYEGTVVYEMVRYVIDGQNDDKGWGTPQNTIPHRLVVKPEHPITANATALRIVLRQNHFNDAHKLGLLIGRFRLSATDDPRAIEQEHSRFTVLKVTDPWAKLIAAYVLAGDAQRAADLLALAVAKTDIAALLESGSLTGEVLDSLQARHPDSYAALSPKLALAAGERGKLELARDLYARLAKLQPENELWKERAEQFRTGAIAVWNFDTEPAPWRSIADCELVVQNGALTARTTGGDPQLLTPVSGPAGGKAVVLRYRTDEPFTMQVFWADSTGGLAESRHRDYPIPASLGEWREITLPFWCHGTLNTLRLDPNTAKEHPLEIDSIVVRQVEPSEAWNQSPDWATRKAILDAVSQNDDLLLPLVKLHPDAPHWQLALGRSLTARGKQALAGDKPPEALSLLKQAQQAFARSLSPPKWTALTPTEFQSAAGETFTVEKDGSIIVSGPDPDRAVYTLKLKTDLPTVSAIRLETIPDPRLPHGGAGRDPANGNFHVSELTAAIVSGDANDRSTPIVFSSAIADTQQSMSATASNIIDGNPQTRWDTYPKTGEVHWAVCGLEVPVQMDGGELSITLDSGVSPWPKHGLGRFRLSVTSDTDALSRSLLSLDVTRSDIADLHASLAIAHARVGQTNAAVASFRQAIDLATDRAGQARIVAAAAPLAGMLEKLAERAAGSAQFQAELTRHFAEQGDPTKANAARALARGLFETEFAKQPENPVLAAELADLLLIDTTWTAMIPSELKPEGGAILKRQDDGSMLVKPASNTSPGTVLWQPLPYRAHVVRIQTDPQTAPLAGSASAFGDYQIVSASRATSGAGATGGRFVRLDLPGKNKTVNLAELQVFQGDRNIAFQQTARQSSDFDATRFPAERAVDGNTVGNDTTSSYAHTNFEDNSWWEVDLGSEQAIDRIVVWNRSDVELHPRMNHFRIRVLDDSRKVVFETVIDKAPSPSAEILLPVFLADTKNAPTSDQQALVMRLPAKDAPYRIRVWVTGDAAILAQPESEERRSGIATITDPWAKLATAYHLAGDQAALDELLKRHPEAAPGIGDRYAAEKNWEQAIAAFNQAITPETTDAKLLAKRAEAYEQLQQWDLAASDWTRASQQQHDVAFERFKPTGAGSWGTGLQEGGAGSMEFVDETLVFTTTVATGTGWHVQAIQAPLRLENGVEYVIRFQMRSPDSCPVSLLAAINQPDWHGIGLQETFVPPMEFKDYEFTFIVQNAVPGNSAIKFDLGSKPGQVMVKEIVILRKSSPAELQSAFDRSWKADRWNEAAGFGLQLVQRKREDISEDPLVWLRVAPVLALADDQAAYADFCDRMAQHFADSDLPGVSEKIVKAALLRPNSIELAKLPSDRLAKTLDDGTGPEWFPPWGWGTRALWAYRNDDAAAAMTYVTKSEESTPSEVAHALNLDIRALAQIRLKRTKEARQTLKEAQQAIERLQADPTKRDHDLLIAQILFREAESLVNGRK